jgi:lipopolysaccharide/colanic/teichoic acid biosynthesis glycosyltransferase
MVKLVSKRRSGRAILRVQLAGALLLAAILPYIVRALTIGGHGLSGVSTVTFLAVMIAIVVGTWLFRNIGAFPGVEASAYALPAFSIVFGALVIVFVLGRIPYDRVLLAAGYVLTLAWFYGVQVTYQPRIPVIGTLPGVDLKNLDLRSFRVVALDHPNATTRQIDIVAADLRSDMPDEWESRLAEYALAGLPVYHVKHLAESLTGRVELEHLSENNFGSLSPVSAFMQIKHLVDAIVALVAGIALSPLFLAVALVIRLTSPGPALFRQVRIGYRGKRFVVYKFRTMRHADASDDARSAAITRTSDDRITPIGRFLRTSRLDELPQILNILKGEMSWIGPRPEAEVLSSWYRQEIPYYAYRHIVRPGITGWAQVCQGHVATVDEVKEKLHYDFYYIKNFSPWLDILIIARTLQTMVTGFGSK